MHPVGHERLAGGRLALSDLIGVMREDEVHTAGVDVERRAQVAHAHGRAFDVPAGPPLADGRIPARFVGLGSLPESEVAHVILGVVVGLHPLPYPHALRIESSQPPIVRPRGNPEEDRAVIGPIGVASIQQRLDQLDHLRDVFGRFGHDVRKGHAERLHVRYEQRPVPLRELFDSCSLGPGAVDDPVVDIGDIHHPRDLEPAIAQVPNEQVVEEKGPEVADVGRSVHGGAAAVDPDMPGLEGYEVASRPGQGVVQPDSHASASPSVVEMWPATAAARSAGTSQAIACTEMDRPAPSAPPRLPVEALTLTAEASMPSAPAIASPIAGSSAARRGRAAVIVRSTLAGLQPVARTLSATLASRTRLSIPAGVRSSAGNSLPRSPSPAAPRRASATAWRAASPSE